LIKIPTKTQDKRTAKIERNSYKRMGTTNNIKDNMDQSPCWDSFIPSLILFDFLKDENGWSSVNK
jgi:hypothetical protein